MANAEKAATTLAHYFKIAWEAAGLTWNADNYAEVLEAVRGIVDEAVHAER